MVITWCDWLLILHNISIHLSVYIQYIYSCKDTLTSIYKLMQTYASKYIYLIRYSMLYALCACVCV